LCDQHGALSISLRCGAPFQGFDELQVHMLTTHFEDAAAEPMKVDEKQAESTTLQT
jgi:hypothetical protein